MDATARQEPTHVYTYLLYVLGSAMDLKGACTTHDARRRVFWSTSRRSMNARCSSLSQGEGLETGTRVRQANDVRTEGDFSYVLSRWVLVENLNVRDGNA